MTLVRVGDLVLDERLYPRTSVWGQHVEELADALKAGAEFPPLIAEQSTLRIVDGAHRREAYAKVYGDERKVDVELRTYPDERTLFMEAAALNMGHGKRLSSYDIVRVMEIGQELGIDDSLLAQNLRVTPEKLTTLRVQKVAYRPTGEPMAIRRSVKHLAGTQLSEVQEEGVGVMGGQMPIYSVNQVTNMLRYDLVDGENVRLVAALDELHGYLHGFLAAHGEGRDG